MKRSYLIVIVSVLFLSGLLSEGGAQEEIIPEGMELRLVGQTNIIVPEDAKVKEQGGLIIIEQIDQYVARTLSEMRLKIETLEKQQEELIKEVTQLKADLEK